MALGIGLGIGASLLQSRSNRRAARHAADAQEKSFQRSSQRLNDFNRTILDHRQRGLDRFGDHLGTYRRAGESALNQYQNINLHDVTNLPGYEFALGEGTRALNRSYAQRGLHSSGAHQRALAEYGQNYANQHANNYINQQRGLLSPLIHLGFQSDAARNNALQSIDNTALSAQANVLSSHLGLDRGLGQAQYARHIDQANLNNTALGNVLGFAALGFDRLGSGGTKTPKTSTSRSGGVRSMTHTSYAPALTNVPPPPKPLWERPQGLGSTLYRPGG